MSILSKKPSSDAGFFVVPIMAPFDSAIRRRGFWNFLRARLCLAFASVACLWLTACSCLPAGHRLVSIQQTPGVPMAATNFDADVNLTILTYNVWGLPSWMNHQPKARYARIAGDLERLHPDVALLQEVWTKAAGAVAPTNGGWLVAQASSPYFFRRNGLMVLSRLPISGGEFHRFSQAAFPDSMVRKGALKVTVQTPGGQRLNIWDVHLQSDAPRVRRRQIRQLVAWVREADNGQVADLVGGDFNSTPDSPEFKLLSRELGPTAHEVAHVPFLPTYDDRSPDPKVAQTIDYLFIRPRSLISKLEAAPALSFTNANLRQRFSDHVALKVAVRFHAESFFASASLTNGASQYPIARSLQTSSLIGY
jgi:endonuclease/exonuclease/phosphatase family metal-dependent hydrolase